MATGLIINTFKVQVGSKDVEPGDSYLLRQKIDEFVNSQVFKEKFAQGGEFKFALSQNRLQVFKKDGQEFKLQEITTETIEKTAQSFANLYTSHPLRSTRTEHPQRSDVTGESNLHASYSLFNIPSLRRRIDDETSALLSNDPLLVGTLKRFLPTGLATSEIKTTSLLEKALENAPLSKTTATFEGAEFTDEIKAECRTKKGYQDFLKETESHNKITLQYQANQNFDEMFKNFLTSSKDLTLSGGLFSKDKFKGKIRKKRKFAPLESLYIKIPRNKEQSKVNLEGIPLKIKQDDQEVELKGFICYQDNGDGTPLAVAYFKEFNLQTGQFHWVKSLGGHREILDNPRDGALPQEIQDSLGKATDLYYDSDKNLFEEARQGPAPFTIE